jgi:hypothetical protein
MLRRYLHDHGTAPDGRLFRGARGGPLSESVYGCTWQQARILALGPGLAATALARRPYDLRHAALSLWLNADGDLAQIAARAGHSVAMLLAVYTHCIHGRDDILNQQIDTALRTAPPTAHRPVADDPGSRPCPAAAAMRTQPCRSPATAGHPIPPGHYTARPADAAGPPDRARHAARPT